MFSLNFLNPVFLLHNHSICDIFFLFKNLYSSMFCHICVYRMFLCCTSMFFYVSMFLCFFNLNLFPLCFCVCLTFLRFYVSSTILCSFKVSMFIECLCVCLIFLRFYASLMFLCSIQTFDGCFFWNFIMIFNYFNSVSSTIINVCQISILIVFSFLYLKIFISLSGLLLLCVIVFCVLYFVVS